MIVVFPFAGDVPASIAEAMIVSVNKTMPGVPVWQLTDMDTPQVRGAMAVRRKRGDWAMFYLHHMLDLPETNVLRLDYDVVVQRDVRPIFNMAFDLAFTRRPLNDLTCSNSMRVRNPHNHGVIFQKKAKLFYQKVLKIYQSYKGADGWMDIALAKEDAASDPDINWIELPGERYNYTPKLREEDVSHCSIVHYKGGRKWWMVDSPEAKAAGEDVIQKVAQHTGGA